MSTPVLPFSPVEADYTSPLQQHNFYLRGDAFESYASYSCNAKDQNNESGDELLEQAIRLVAQ